MVSSEPEANCHRPWKLDPLVVSYNEVRNVNLEGLQGEVHTLTSGSSPFLLSSFDAKHSVIPGISRITVARHVRSTMPTKSNFGMSGLNYRSWIKKTSDKNEMKLTSSWNEQPDSLKSNEVACCKFPVNRSETTLICDFSPLSFDA